MIEAKEQRAFADGDARIMLMKRGAYDYADNAQAAGDAERGVIVAAALTNVAPDMGHLPELVADVRALCVVADVPVTEPTPVSADAGSFSGDNIAADGAGIALLIAAGRSEPTTRRLPGQPYTAEAFAYEAARDVWLCPADKVLTLQQTPPGARGRPKKDYYEAAVADCAACPLRAHCLKPGAERRVLLVRNRRTTGGMRDTLRQADARRRYARRKVIVAPIFGRSKEDRGFRAFGLRGLRLARGEWLLACLAHTLGKVLRVCPLPAASAAG